MTDRTAPRSKSTDPNADTLLADAYSAAHDRRPNQMLEDLTAADLPALGRAIAEDAARVFVARVVAEELAERMRGVDVALLDRFPHIDEDTGERITDPERTYLADGTEDAAGFFAARDAWVAEHFPEVPREHCPALIAAAAARDAEAALLRAAHLAGVPGMDPERLRYRAAFWTRGVDLCLTLAAPFC